MERLDALSVRESNGKSYFTKIGVAFPSRNGNGYSVLLDAIPAPIEGQFKILLMEPKPREGGNQTTGQKQPAYSSNYDDDVPGF